MTPRREKTPIIHPVLLAAFPVLFLYSSNMAKVPAGVVFLPLSVAVSSALLLWFFMRLMLKDYHKAAVAASIFILFFYSYGYFHDLARVICYIAGIACVGRTVFAVWLAFMAVSEFFCVTARRGLRGGSRLFNIAAFFLVGASLANIAVYKLSAADFKKISGGKVLLQNPAKAVFAKEALPHIYYIVLDAYAATGILKEVYGYDNSEFLGYLKKKGFYVAEKASSNYCQTILTLASSFNLCYLDSIAEKKGEKCTDLQPARNMFKESFAFYFLKQHGYEIVAFSTGWTGGTELGNADRYIEPQWPMNDFLSMLLDITMLGPLLNLSKRLNQFERHRKRILYNMDNLHVPCVSEGPVFVFAHIVAPHPPFVFGENGERLKASSKLLFDDANLLISAGRLTAEEYRKRYVGQLIFINKKIKKSIDKILSASKRPTIIILQADHGPRSMLDGENPENTDFKEALSILKTFYFPKRDYGDLYDAISPVNTFRVIFNRYFAADYGLLEDRHYFSTWSRPRKFIDVTKEINE